MESLKPGEKRLAFAASLAVLFFLGWSFFLSPALSAVEKTKSKVAAAKQQLDLPMQKPQNAVYPQEAQLNHIMNFLDDRFRWHGIKLVSLKQSFGANKLTIDLQFESTYSQLNGFLDALEKIDTLLVVDQAKVVQRESRVLVDLRLLSGYL